ncbi:MAG: fimbria/pilus periplasmic chaperone [Luteitalea sp.]|nr:fimbria/pilus periplasmic chaperone [Luteitalea sp.]
MGSMCSVRRQPRRTQSRPAPIRQRLPQLSLFDMGPGRSAAGGLIMLLGLVPLAYSAGQSGGQLQAGPTLLEIGPKVAATRLLLGNTGDAPVAAQVRVYAWRQSDGEDRLVPSDQVVVSPPIVELPAGREQVVRVVRLGPPASGRDHCYRIIVDELPRAERAEGNRVKLRMRYVLPLFVRAAEASTPALTCTIDAGGVLLMCENSGGRAAQLGASRLLDDETQVLNLSEGLFGYVLPGSRRVWSLAAHRPALKGQTLRLETRLNGHPAKLAVDRAP